MSTVRNFLDIVRSWGRQSDELEVPDSRRLCDWNKMVFDIRERNPPLAAEFEIFLARLRIAAYEREVPVYARLLLALSSYDSRAPFLKIGIFPARRSTDRAMLEYVVTHALTLSEHSRSECDDPDMGRCMRFQIDIPRSPVGIKVLTPAGEWSDASLPTRIRNEENPAQPEFGQKPFRYAFIRIGTSKAAADPRHQERFPLKFETA